jgi:hypothetical protein
MGNAQSNPNSTWSSTLIQALWHFTSSLWQHRNQLVHGIIMEDQANKVLQDLHMQVEHHYAACREDDAYVLPRHSYLFTQQTLAQWLTYSYDYLRCWLRSVEKARSIVQFQEHHLRETSTQFFNLFHCNTSPSEESDSTYIPLSEEDDSHYSTYTLTTTSLTNTTDDMMDTLSTTSHSTTTSVPTISTDFLIRPIFISKQPP